MAAMVKSAAEILAGVPENLRYESTRDTSSRQTEADRYHAQSASWRIREWCRQAGLPVPPSGVIARIYLDAYNAAHPDEEPR